MGPEARGGCSVVLRRPGRRTRSRCCHAHDRNRVHYMYITSCICSGFARFPLKLRSRPARVNMGRMPGIAGPEHFCCSKLAAALQKRSHERVAGGHMLAVDRVDVGGAPCVMPGVRVVAATAKLRYREAEIGRADV